MSSVNIVTSLCIDKVDSEYFQLSPNLRDEQSFSCNDQKELWKKQRELYWRCVTTFFLTSKRVNTDACHILYTNDIEEIIIDEYNIKQILSDKGVEIKYLEFNKFDTKRLSKKFRLAYYKFEVIEQLQYFSSPSILMDADCIWCTHKKALFKSLCSSDNLFLYDPKMFSKRNHTQVLYQRILNIFREQAGIKALYNFYLGLQLHTPHKNCVRWWGGEFLGASPENYKKIAESLYELMAHCLRLHDNGEQEKLYFSSTSIFEHDELMTSYVYATQRFKIFNACPKYIKRIWPVHGAYNIRHNDLKKSCWHLPAQKENDLQKLFYEIIKADSKFYTIPSNKVAEFLGSFVQIYNLPCFIRLKKILYKIIQRFTL